MSESLSQPFHCSHQRVSMQETEGIFVGIRLRPLNDREKNSGQEKIFASQNNNSVHQTCHGQPIENQTYHYDRVFNETSTTAEVYEATARNIVQNVLGGINGCIFACKLRLRLLI